MASIHVCIRVVTINAPSLETLLTRQQILAQAEGASREELKRMVDLLSQHVVTLTQQRDFLVRESAVLLGQVRRAEFGRSTDKAELLCKSMEIDMPQE